MLPTLMMMKVKFLMTWRRYFRQSPLTFAKLITFRASSYPYPDIYLFRDLCTKTFEHLAAELGEEFEYREEQEDSVPANQKPPKLRFVLLSQALSTLSTLLDMAPAISFPEVEEHVPSDIYNVSQSSLIGGAALDLLLMCGGGCED